MIIMKTEPEVDWQATFLREVRANDGSVVGIVAGIRRETLIVQDSPKNEYIVPKENVEGFNGQQVKLDISKQ
jgi:hypothetical protein